MAADTRGFSMKNKPKNTPFSKTRSISACQARTSPTHKFSEVGYFSNKNRFSAKLVSAQPAETSKINFFQKLKNAFPQARHARVPVKIQTFSANLCNIRRSWCQSSLEKRIKRIFYSQEEDSFMQARHDFMLLNLIISHDFSIFSKPLSLANTTKS